MTDGWVVSSPETSAIRSIGSRLLGRLISAGSVPAATLVCVAGLNFLFFLTFARFLDANEFVLFATAAAIVMFAMSIAEAGSIFVAPAVVGPYSGVRAARLAAGFVAVSTLLLALGILLGSLVWVAFSDAPLSVRWLVRYGLLLLPNLALQNWLVVRLRTPFRTLATVTLIRALPILAIGQPMIFDGLLVVSLVAAAAILARDTRQARSLDRPRVRDLALCASLLRRVFALRLLATTVTSCAPLLLGLIASPAAVAAYLLGDRIKVLVAAAFQPFVQGLYLVRCRQTGDEFDRSLALSAIVVLLVAVTGGTLLAWQAGLLNQILYDSKYPDAQSLAMFVIAGHVSVVASLGYFLVLIPSGRTPTFIKAVVGQVLIFISLLFLLSPGAPVTGPAIAILVAECFLLIVVAIPSVVVAIRTRRHAAHGRV